MKHIVPQNGSLLERTSEREELKSNPQEDSQKEFSPAISLHEDEFCDSQYEDKEIKKESTITQKKEEKLKLPLPPPPPHHLLLHPLPPPIDVDIQVDNKQAEKVTLTKPVTIQSDIQNKQQQPPPQQKQQIQQTQQVKSPVAVPKQDKPQTLQSQEQKEMKQTIKFSVKESLTQTIKSELDKIKEQQQQIQLQLQSKNIPNEGLNMIVQQLEKAQEFSLKKQDQFLNQQKYQQCNFLAQSNNSRSLSRDKKQSGEKQQIFEKIEELVKMQRPKSSSFHNQGNTQNKKAPLENKQNNQQTKGTIKEDSSNTITQTDQQKNGSNAMHLLKGELKNSNGSSAQDSMKETLQNSSKNLANQENTHGNSNGMREGRGVPGQQNQFLVNFVKMNQIVAENSLQNPTKLNHSPNNVIPFEINPSHQGCISEPSNSTKTEPRNKRTSLHDASSQPAHARSKKNSSYFIYQAQSNASQAFHSTSNSNSKQQSSTQQSLTSEPVSFLKSFNQFMKQTRLQDDRRQFEPHKPQALLKKDCIQQDQLIQNQGTSPLFGESGSKIKTQPETRKEEEDDKQQKQGMQQQNNQTEQDSNNFNLNEFTQFKKRAQKNVNKIKLLEQHRVSLPDTFLSSLTSKSSGSSSNNKSQGKPSSSLNYSAKQNNEQQLLDNYHAHQPQNNSSSKNANIENIMPIRHSSEPLNQIPFNTLQQQNLLIKSKLTSSQEKDSNDNTNTNTNTKEKKLSLFKTGDITISTNFTDPLLLNQEDFLKTLEINNAATLSKSSQNKRTNSASHSKNIANSTRSAASTQPFTSPTSTISQDNHPLMNNFTNLNINNIQQQQQQQQQSQQSQQQQYQFQQSLSSTQQQYQMHQQQLQSQHQQQQQQQQQLLQQQQGIITKQSQFTIGNQQNQTKQCFQFQQQPQQQQQHLPLSAQALLLAQQNILSAFNCNQANPNNGNPLSNSNTVNFNCNPNTLSSSLDQRPSSGQKTAGRSGQKRKMVAANMQLSDKVVFQHIKSPTNSFIPSSTSSSFVQSPQLFSLSVNSKLNNFQKGFAQPSKIVFPSSTSSSSASQNQQLRDSSQRKRRVKTDHDSNTQTSSSNQAPKDADNRTRSSIERPKSNYNYSRLKTLI